MEKIVTIRLEDSYTEKEFQEMLLRRGKTEEEYIEICQEQIAEAFERTTSSKIQSVEVKIIDTGTLKKTRIYND